MALPFPSSGDIASRGAAVFEENLAGIDARTPNAVATTVTRVNEMTIFDLYFYLAYIQRELMVTTAEDYLPQHASIWGVPRNQATAAAGNVVVQGGANAAFPAGAVFSRAGSNITYVSTSAVTLSGAGSASVPVVAQVSGAAGDVTAGATLTLTNPIADIYPQTGVVDANGITGGGDIEDIESWRARILLQIRKRPMGGALQDYTEWAETALTDVAYVNPVPVMFGPGTVGVPFLMAGPTVPTAAQVASVQAYLDSVRPVTATVTAIAGALNPVNFVLHLSPDTTETRAAAQAALQYYFLQSAALGGTTYFSAWNNAVSSGDGETYHEAISPTADVAAPNAVTMNVLGTVTFQ
ncbi:baseplate J/gp47 family protein [Acidocella sp.]|uniref:baseplate J/gp47 family protein n=1 Tax=Acidocella sp. TaxID=50710 RepID=UPI002602968A|nr:baseplate J/gp47 family protein [Acidocella sp.]